MTTLRLPLLAALLSACAGMPASGDDASLEAAALGTAPAFQLAPTGCPMAHCSPHEDDYDAELAPTSIVSVRHDATSRGSSIGLGCASNGSVAVCTMASVPAVVAFDASLAHLWDSGTLLDATTFTSAAMVDASGGAIAADDKHIIRFDGKGNVIWQQPTPGGDPISPVPLSNGLIVLATKASGGRSPISTYDGASTNGAPGVPLQLTDSDETGNYIWETANTPTTNGNRIYVSMDRQPAPGNPNTKDPKSKGALMAIDVAASGMTKVWEFDFIGPSGASPLRTDNGIYFDGAGYGSVNSPLFFGVEDVVDASGNATWQLLWTYALPAAADCNAAHDPRGGVWTFGASASNPYMVRLDEKPPAGCTSNCAAVVDQTLDFRTLFRDDKASPSPTISLANTATTRPQMIITAALSTGRPLADIDLVSSTVVWEELAVDDGGVDRTSVGQYPVLTTASGAQAIVYTTIDGGTFSMIGPKASH